MAAATASMSLTALPQCQILGRQGLGLAAPSRKFKAQKNKARIVMSASPPEKNDNNSTSTAVAQFTALALVASAALPEIAEASVTPSLKNFLLSVAAGLGVLGLILGTVFAVARFDPIKRS